jgi:hypothetical protein
MPHIKRLGLGGMSSTPVSPSRWLPRGCVGGPRRPRCGGGSRRQRGPQPLRRPAHREPQGGPAASARCAGWRAGAGSKEGPRGQGAAIVSRCPNRLPALPAAGGPREDVSGAAEGAAVTGARPHSSSNPAEPPAWRAPRPYVQPRAPAVWPGLRWHHRAPFGLPGAGPAPCWRRPSTWSSASKSSP